MIGAPRAKDQTLVSSMQHKCLAIELFLPALQHFIIRKQLHICLCLSLQRELVLREIEMSNTFFFILGGNHIWMIKENHFLRDRLPVIMGQRFLKSNYLVKPINNYNL